MPKYSEEANKLWPHLIAKVQKVATATVPTVVVQGGSGGGGGLTAHALDGAYHTGTLDDAQGPQFLLVDGSRTLTGNLAVSSSVTIDGVDLSVHVADPAAHHDPVTAGNGIDVTGQVVAVDETYAFDWTGEHTFNADIELDSDLNFFGGDHQITSGMGIDLTIDLGGDLILDNDDTFRSSDYADGIPIAGFSNHINSAGNRQLTINSIKADELHVRLFVADTVRVDVGEEYWGKSMGIVHDDFTTPSSLGGTVTVNFEDSAAFSGPLFSNDDWLLIRHVDRDIGLDVGSIWGQVSSYSDLGDDADGMGHQSWTFTLRQGATDKLVKAGNVAVDFGASGQGYVHLSTLDSADGPWIQIGTWSGANPYTPGNRTIQTQMGSLENISDSVTNPSGFGFYSDNAYLKGIVSAATDIVRLDEDGIRVKGQPGDYDALYSYEFQNEAGVEVGGLYMFYTDSTTDLASIALRAVGSSGIRPAVGVAATSAESGVAGSPLIDIRAQNTDTSVNASITMDVSPTVGTMVLSASDYVSIVSDLQTNDVLPATDVTYDLGSGSFRYNTLYVNQIIASAISGDTIGGQEWEYAGSMVIDANSGSNTTVSVANQGAGRADLDVDRNITLGGTIDGVDLAAHVGSANAHHNAVTVGNTGLSLSTQVLSLALAATSGLQISSGLMLADTVAGAGLGITSKVMAVNVGDGIQIASDAVAVNSTVVRTTRNLVAGAGLTGGGTLAADRTFNVIAGNGIVVAADSVAVDVEPTRGLEFVGGDLAMGAPTAVTATSMDGFSGAGHAHSADSSSDVSAGIQKLLESTGAGGLGLASMFTTGAVDVGGQLFAANDTFRVYHHTDGGDHAHVVINPTGAFSGVDEQFGVDIWDNLLVRGFIVGRHALQVKNARMLVHFDGGGRLEGETTGDPTGHMGQVGKRVGGVAYFPGEFGKAAALGEATTNLITNPSFETNTTGWTTAGSGSSDFQRRTDSNFVGYYGAWFYTGDDYYELRSPTFTLTSGQTYTLSFYVKSFSGAKTNWIVRFARAGTGVTEYTVIDPEDDWKRVTSTHTCTVTGTYYISIYRTVAAVSRILIDGFQVENKAYATPYCDGSLGADEPGLASGFSWSGTAHASTSSRLDGYLYYDDDSLLDFGTNPITVMAWVKPTSESSFQTIVSKVDSGYTRGWGLTNSSGTLRLTLRNPTVDLYGDDLSLNEWNFVAFTYDRSNARLYLNGAEVGSVSATQAVASVDPLRVGRRATGNNFNGLIDELSLIDSALSADEIKAIYESNAPIFAETSVFHFRAGRNRIYADTEGLWGFGASGGTILGLYAGEDNNPSATKSWGGLSLSEGDFLLGRYGASDGGWMYFDQDLVSGEPSLSFGYADNPVVEFDATGARVSGDLYAGDDGVLINEEGIRLLTTTDDPSPDHIFSTGSTFFIEDDATGVPFFYLSGARVSGDHTASMVVTGEGSGFDKLYLAVGSSVGVHTPRLVLDNDGTQRATLDASNVYIGHPSGADSGSNIILSGQRMYFDGAMAVTRSIGTYSGKSLRIDQVGGGAHYIPLYV